MVSVVEYYSRPEVKKEIYDFLIDRWAGIEGEDKKWIRWERDKPLRLSNADDVTRLVKKYHYIKPRSFYGTIERFKRLETKSDVTEKYEENVSLVTPFIDIDIIDESMISRGWVYVCKIAETITSFLHDHGVIESVYIVWSGAGMHLRINEHAFREVVVKHHPLDVAFAVTEYILESLKPHLYDIIRESNGLVKIENLVAMKRVFTAPLSLHRRLESVVVALKPDKLNEFTLEWSNPEKPVHDPRAWREYIEGEADNLAEEALEQVGKVKKHTLLEARATRLGIYIRTVSLKTKPVTEASEKRGPGRFPVMALLQATRYYLLKGDLVKAKSFGLNRAIFYAWAKYYRASKRTIPASRSKRIYGCKTAGPIKMVEEIGEKTQIGPSGFFVIGGVEQRPEDFDIHVARKFEEAGIPFQEAWKAALEYVSKFPRTVLKDPQLFYKEVYEPVRDSFVEKVLHRKSGGEKISGLDKWLKKTR